MSKAPVCNINQPAPQPQPTNSPVVVPVATSTNIVEVVNALRTVVAAMTNQSPGSAGSLSLLKPKFTGVKNTTPPNRKGGGTNQNPPGQKQSSFKQSNITIQKIKVSNPNDSSQFVTVNQVTSLTMVNPVTGETWTWTAPSSVPGSGG